MISKRPQRKWFVRNVNSPHLDKDYKTAYWVVKTGILNSNYGLENSVLWEAGECIVGSLAASLTSAHLMPVALPPQLWQPKIPPNTTKYSGGQNCPLRTSVLRTIFMATRSTETMPWLFMTSSPMLASSWTWPLVHLPVLLILMLCSLPDALASAFQTIFCL